MSVALTVARNFRNFAQGKTIQVELKNIKTKKELFDTFKDSLSFPDYFGYNFDALNDCMTDLSWLIGVDKIIVTVNSDVLIDSLKDRKLLKDILDNCQDYWENEGKGLTFTVKYN